MLALAGARRMKGHSCYAMCGAGAAPGERAANTVRTDTRQDGQTLDGSQRPERVDISCEFGLEIQRSSNAQGPDSNTSRSVSIVPIQIIASKAIRALIQ